MPESFEFNLTLGLLALQRGIVAGGRLEEAFRVWIADPSTPLAEVLQQHEIVDATSRDLLNALAREHLAQTVWTPQRGLATTSAVSGTQNFAPFSEEGLSGFSAELRAGQSQSSMGQRALSTATHGNRFRLLKSHASGGLGHVSVAIDTELNREVALKEIRPEHADNADVRSRFVLEAEITGRLEHPGIVPIYGLGDSVDGRPFYAMKFIKGQSLKAALEKFHSHGKSGQRLDSPERNMEFRQLLGQFVAMCHAMEYAHHRGVVHRDLKPENVMVGEFGETLVVDWGLAKSMGAEATGTMIVPDAWYSQSSHGETLPGMPLGTPSYMSPEQAKGDLARIGPASDIYSLGASLFHVLTGRAPFTGGSIWDLLTRVKQGDFKSPREVHSGVPRALDRICRKAMALKPEERYENARLLADDVEHWMADEPIEGYRESLATRFARWARRHRGGVLTAVVAIIVLTFGSLAANVLINQQRREAQRQRGEADKQKVVAEELASRNAELAKQEQAAAKLAKVEADRARKNAEVAEAQRVLAGQERDRANEQTELVAKERDNTALERDRAQAARDRAEWLLYTSRIGLAQREWEEGNAGRALEIVHQCQANLRNWEYYFLAAQFDRGQRSLIGHPAGIGGLAFNSDGTRLVSADERGGLLVWNVAKAEKELTLEGHEQAVNGAAFSGDGKLIASGSADGTVRLWNAADGKLIATLAGHADRVNSVAFHARQPLLISGSGDGTVKLWNLTTEKEQATFDGHTGSVNAVLFDRDGNRILSGSSDLTIKVWNITSGNDLQTLRGHSGPVSAISLSSDGKQLLSGGLDRTLRVWDLAAARELRSIVAHDGSITCVSFRPGNYTDDDGKPTYQAVSGGIDGLLKIWDVDNGSELRRLRGHVGAVSAVAFSPDAKDIASGGLDQKVRLWDAVHGQDPLTLRGHLRGVATVAVSADGQHILSGSSDETVKLWSKSGELVRTFGGHEGSVLSVAFHKASKQIASGGMDRVVKLWDTETGVTLQTLEGHEHWVTGIALNPEGTRLASGSRDQTVRVWNPETAEILHVLSGHTERVNCVAYHPDGTLLASGSDDRSVRIWNGETGETVLTLAGHENGVASVAFSPDGKRLASSSADSTIKIWDSTTGAEVFHLQGHLNRVNSIVYTSDGTRLISASDDQTLKIWDTLTGQATLTLKAHDNAVSSLAFSPELQRVISGSYDRTVRIWEAPAPLK